MILPIITVDDMTAGVSVENDDPTISVIWDQAVQAAVIDVSPGPTIASRAYAILHTAMFEAWAGYDLTAIGLAFGDELQVTADQILDENKELAMSYAAYVALLDLFPDQQAIFDAVMEGLGLSTDLSAYENIDETTDPDTVLDDPIALGILAGRGVIAARSEDGSNQAGGYADTTGYAPVNIDPEHVNELDRWTPTYVPIDTVEPETLQTFLTPHWGDVTSFASYDIEALRPAAPEPFFLPSLDASVDKAAGTITLHGLSDEATKADFKVLSQGLREAFAQTDAIGDVNRFLRDAKAQLKTGEAPETPLTLDVSKALIGPVINPEFIAQAEVVIAASAALTQEQQVIAEFWEDGIGTAFPPGTFMSFGQFVSARDEHTLDEDAQMFFTLANAVMDAGILTWGAKAFYDYSRPVSVIRDLGELGLIGEWGTDYLGNEGYVITAWAGEDVGVTQILAVDFITYQNPLADASPPFAEYTSGHSAFSAAGAEVLELFTGSEEFGGLVEIDFFLFQDQDPDPSIILEWETFKDAADEAGISRIYGGIHFEDGDQNGRDLGEEIGAAVFATAEEYISGEADEFLLV